jgi:O-antigen ligase
LGFGPGNFYGNYKQYALERFRTYVSDNPERSGVHNYYLMTAIEQGLIGLIIFLILTFFSILYGQKVYHQTIGLKRKELVMSFILSLVVIDAFLLMNDMIETCKIGSFYFMNLSAIVIIDLNNRSMSKELQEIQD